MQNQNERIMTPDIAENAIAEKILDAAFKIHRMYGPGLLESAYEHILEYELSKNNGLNVERQKAIPIVHEEIKIDAGYRIDLLVENTVIIELKCIDKILPVHQAQLITYLKLSSLRLGLIINFKTPLLKDGIKRIIV